MNETIKNHQVKITVGTIVAVMLFAIYTTISVMTILNKQQNTLDLFEEKSQTIDERSRNNEEELRNLSEECQENEVRYAEIKIRLTGIEALLFDLKQRLK
jgi:cell division protein FtsL